MSVKKKTQSKRNQSINQHTHTHTHRVYKRIQREKDTECLYGEKKVGKNKKRNNTEKEVFIEKKLFKDRKDKMKRIY